MLADMENINEFPVCVTAFTTLSSLRLDQAVFFPGNDRHGVWSSPYLELVYSEPIVRSRRPPRAKPPAVPATDAIPVPSTPAASAVPPSQPNPKPSSVAGRAGSQPRN